MSRIRDEILQTSGESEGKYWSVSRGGETRLDIRFSAGVRTSVQYHSIQKLEIFEKGYDDAEDILVLDLTGVSRFEIIGNNLLPIYEALNRQSARFIAAATNEEDREDENGVLVRIIREFSAEEMMEEKSQHSDESVGDQKAIEDFMDELSEEEAGEMVNEAYRLARESGDTLIDEQSEPGERARWEAVAKLVRTKI